jgi:D-glycero-alpha-D-manno-heptose-7-phosphate kinase
VARKRQLDPGVSAPKSTDYATGREAGAIGGKLLGAGGGGFMLLLVPPERQAACAPR